MAGSGHDDAVKYPGKSIGIRVYAGLMLAIAVVLMAGGVYLLTLGGSPYYALMGLCLLVAAIALERMTRRGPPGR